MNVIPKSKGIFDVRLGWHAIYTRHQHEKAVAHILSDRGFEIFLPLYNTARRWKDRTKQLALPLFPCYVFIRSALDRRFDIITTPGFHSFVGTRERAAIIPCEEVEAIRKALEGGSLVEPCQFLRCGDRVRITSGPLEGLDGILSRKKNSFRLVLSVELLEKSVAVEVDSSLVEHVASPQGAPTFSWSASVAQL